ncbi:MAG: signal peptidase II [Ignavibacteriaceae bacterium]
MGESKPLIGNVVNITLVENPGIAFGIIPGTVLKELILILTILLCIGLAVYLVTAKNADRKVRISIGLILAGAAGNLFDRIFYGYFFGYAPIFHGRVVDFLDVKIFKIFMFGDKLGNYIFNFADLSITLGIFTLIYLIFRIRNQNNEIMLVQKLAEETQDKS